MLKFAVLLCSLCAALAPVWVAAQQRTPWTTSNIQGAPTAPPPYRAEVAFPKLKFQNPTVLTNAPGMDRMFVAELRGKIYSFDNRRDVERAELALDLKKAVPEARQIYGLTFHPQFAMNRVCFICYVLEPNREDGTRLSRFQMASLDPPKIAEGSEEILLTWRSGGHNGGCLKFGPDGYLYVSAGDSGPAFPPDPRKAGQDVGNVLSTVMRIDVDGTEGDLKYAIPADNPFVDLPGARREVWAFGFRNPWKMSFDQATGDLWVGDVGWELWEMIYRVRKGGNYGWSLVEGRQSVHRERTRGPTPILEPTAEHSHNEARSITGGFVYRGKRLPALVGRYVYGDYVTGKMWALDPSSADRRIVEIADTRMPIICFGVDNQQQLFVVSYEGRIHRLAARESSNTERSFPRLLSETGLFQSVAGHRLAAGVEPYEIVAEMWQDGVTSERFLAVPGSGPLDTWKANEPTRGQKKGQWRFPENSVIGKTVSLPNQESTRVETQILHFTNGFWEPYTYVWNSQQTDATLVEGPGNSIRYEIPTSGGEPERRVWRVAGREECLLCHTARSGGLQAVHVGQLERTISVDRDANKDAPSRLDQLEHLTLLGFFDHRPQRSDKEKAYVSPYDSAADLDARARAYLHVNCAHCHRRHGGGTAAMDVVHENQLDDTNLISERPTQGTFGIHGAKVVAPAEPYRSVMLYRLSKLGRGRMPYLGAATIDTAGVRMLRDWIKTLPAGDADADRSRRRRDQVAAALLRQARAGDPQQQPAAVAKLLENTSDALRLAVDLHERGSEPALRDAIVARIAKLDDPAIRDLFEFLLPESKRRKSLGENIDPAQILSLAGDRDRGRQLFEKGVGLQCRKCHQTDAGKQSVGPALSQLKKRTRAELLDSILHPSKRIDPQYVTYLVETKDGRVLSGLLVEQNDQRVVLLDALGERRAIPVGEIELRSPQQKSLMPELQLRDSTAQEVADLLEFLLAQ